MNKLGIYAHEMRMNLEESKYTHPLEEKREYRVVLGNDENG